MAVADADRPRGVSRQYFSAPPTSLPH